MRRPQVLARLLTCFVCNHDVASTAKECPNCGYAMPAVCSTCKWYYDGTCTSREELPLDGKCENWKYTYSWNKVA